MIKSFSEVRVQLEIAVQPHNMDMYTCAHIQTHTLFHSSLGGMLVTF